RRLLPAASSRRHELSASFAQRNSARAAALSLRARYARAMRRCAGYRGHRSARASPAIERPAVTLTIPRAAMPSTIACRTMADGGSNGRARNAGQESLPTTAGLSAGLPELRASHAHGRGTLLLHLGRFTLGL